MRDWPARLLLGQGVQCAEASVVAIEKGARRGPIAGVGEPVHGSRADPLDRLGGDDAQVVDEPGRQHEVVDEAQVAEPAEQLPEAVAGQQPPCRGGDVGGLDRQAVERVVGGRGDHLREQADGLGQVVAGVVVASRTRPSCTVEPLGGVLADHLQQPVAGHTTVLGPFHQRLGHQRAEHLDRVELIGTSTRRDGRRGVKVEAADAHRQPVQ